MKNNLHPWGVFKITARQKIVRGPWGTPHLRVVRHHTLVSHHKTEIAAKAAAGRRDYVVMRT